MDYSCMVVQKGSSHLLDHLPGLFQQTSQVFIFLTLSLLNICEYSVFVGLMSYVQNTPVLLYT